MPDPLLLGIDAGTSQVRALVFALDGSVVAAASRPTPVRHLAPGSAEHDPEALWQAVLAVATEAACQSAAAARIRGVAVASVGEAGVLLDSNDRPVAPILAWFDNRTTGDIARFVETSGFERLHRITGLCPDPTHTAAKLLWLRHAMPQAWARGRRWAMVSDWLAMRLGAERATDASLASRTLLLDLERRAWSEELLAQLELPQGFMPPVRRSGARIGTVAPAIAAATGLPADCAIGVGGHDHVCGLLAVGADTPGVLLDSIGTAEQLTLICKAPLADPRLGREGFIQGAVDAGRPLYYVGAGLPTAAAAVEWFRESHGGADHATLIAEAEAAGSAGHEVMFLPHLRLGSPPFPDHAARGAFIGLTAGCGRGALFHAVLEGLALDTAVMLERMRAHLGAPAPDRILVIGGSTQNGLLMRLKVGLFEQPIEIVQTVESTCLGAALLGGLAAGVFPDLDAARQAVGLRTRHVAPDPGWPAASRRARKAAYARCYRALRPLHEALRLGST